MARELFGPMCTLARFEEVRDCSSRTFGIAEARLAKAEDFEDSDEDSGRGSSTDSSGEAASSVQGARGTRWRLQQRAFPRPLAAPRFSLGTYRV